MTPGASQSNRDRHRELTDQLLLARKGLHRALVKASVPTAILLACRAAAVAACVLLTIRLIHRFGVAAPVVRGPLALSLVAVAGLLAAAYILAKTWLRVPSLAQTAERLDLATSDHNRIATALSLLEQPRGDEFAEAAIADGLTHARRLSRQQPYAEAGPQLGAPSRRAAVVAVLACILAMFVSPVGPWLPESIPVALADAGVQASRRPSARTDDVKQPGPQTRPAAAFTASKAEKREASAMRPNAMQTTLNRQALAGTPGGGAIGEANASDQLESSQSESSSSSAKSKPQTKKVSDRRPRKRSPAAAMAAPKPPKGAEEEASSISQGLSGGGAISPVQNNGSQRAETADQEQEEDTFDQPTEDEPEFNSQRGGVQPSLKDRQAAPSNELGISSDDEGTPGTGRGGPTPPKKSRGTAALVLGVPLPDFVKGRLGPGSTKIVHERVEPAAAPGESVPAAPARPRSLPEAVCPSFEIPADMAAIVRNYLIALHSADKDVSTGPAASPQGGPKPQEH